MYQQQVSHSVTQGADIIIELLSLQVSLALRCREGHISCTLRVVRAKSSVAVTSISLSEHYLINTQFPFHACYTAGYRYDDGLSNNFWWTTNKRVAINH